LQGVDNNHVCAHTGTNASRYASTHAGTHTGTNASRYAGTRTHTGTNASRYASTNAGIHIENFLLQRGALRRSLSLPIEMGLLRHIRVSLQCRIHLAGGGLLRRGGLHDRSAHVHSLHCISIRAQLQAGTIKHQWQWQWHRSVVHAG